MLLPIPNGLAEECARDLANDCKKYARDALQLRDAIEKGEANASDKKQYETLIKQIASLGEIVCLDVNTKEEFRVGDYITTRREMTAHLRRFQLAKAYQKLTKWLH